MNEKRETILTTEYGSVLRERQRGVRAVLPDRIRARGLRLIPVLLCLFCVWGALPAMTVSVSAEEGYDQVAGSSAMGETREDLAPYGMTPVPGSLIEDGVYTVGTECSSSFFHIEKAELRVEDGRMTAVLTMSSSSYELVYPGTAEEAAAAPYEDYIPSVETEDLWDTFTIPVDYLDAEMDLAAFSKKKKKWYPRKILLHASDIPAEHLRFEYPDYELIEKAVARYGDAGGGSPGGEKPEEGQNAGASSENAGSSAAPAEPQAVRVDRSDGGYSVEVVLTGGSGRASVTSPTWMNVLDGEAYARLLWSSPHYDYMILGGKKYLNETEDGGNSTFTIPITAFNAPVEIIADTTAMGEPVEIAYTLTFYEETIGAGSRVPQEGAKRILAGAALFIVIGGIVNHLVKKRRER